VLNIEKLIDEVEILNYLEEFDTPTFQRNSISDNMKLFFGWIPIFNNINVYQCVKRTSMSLGQKVAFMIFATTPFTGGFFLLICMLRSKFESLAAANLIPFVTKFTVFLNRLKKMYSKEKNIEIEKIHDNYYQVHFKQLRLKYPTVNTENQLDVAKEYGQLTIKYYEELINKISELYTSELSSDDLLDFSDFKSEFNKAKIDFKNKDWSRKYLSQLGAS